MQKNFLSLSLCTFLGTFFLLKKQLKKHFQQEHRNYAKIRKILLGILGYFALSTVFLLFKLQKPLKKYV